jgi:selenium metabolism protein YedF
MAQGEQVITLVDNDTARANVERMARKAGWAVRVDAEGGEFRIAISPANASTQPEPAPQGAAAVLGRAEPAVGSTVLVVASETMGRGQAELGNILVRGFFHTLGEVEPQPDTIVFFNAGVKLACEGSPVLEELCALEAEGVETLVCGTCLSYFELTESLAVGDVSNMYDIAETMLGAGKVVNL